MPIRVLLYEDNHQLRQSIKAMVAMAEDFERVGDFGNVLHVENQVRQLRPDVVLMDIDLPEMNGIEAVRTIRTFDSRLPIIMLTVFDDHQHLVDAICAGASGFLLKMHLPDKLYEVVKDVMMGGAPMNPGVARLVLSRLQRLPEPPNGCQLTPREKEVLLELSHGNSFRLVAAHFDISIDTLRHHIKKIYEKLYVHTQTEVMK